MTIPRQEIAFIVSRYHVGTPDEKITAELRERINKSPARDQWTPTKIRQALAYTLQCHAKNKALYRAVMGGSR